MVYRTTYLTQEINRYLSELAVALSNANSMNLTDLNIHSEGLFKQLLNLLNDVALENANIDDPNAASIDLGDPAAKLAVQVTAAADVTKKVKHTCNGFAKRKLETTYSKLVILFAAVSTTKDKPRKKPEIAGVEIEIVGQRELYRQILSASSERQEAILSLLQSEMARSSPDNLSNEQMTFINLIGVLSNEDLSGIGKGFEEDPDPDKKIRKRFADEAEFLEAEFVKLHVEYGAALKGILDMPEFTQPKISRLALFLMEVSDRVLRECNGNPVAALDTLVNNFETLLSCKKLPFDRTAIRFFLVYHLTRCNVFPNHRVQNGQPVS